MATSLTRNLSLRIDDNLTDDAKYNLARIDLLGSTFNVDSSQVLNIRSASDIIIEPEALDVGGSGTSGDGNVDIGTTAHTIGTVSIYATEINFRPSLGLFDQGTSGTKYLRLRYNSTISGSVDTTADRTLSIDLNGADRNLTLAGNISLTGDATWVLPPNNGTGNQLLRNDGSGNLTWLSAGSGTVTSIDLTAPSEFSVAGVPITTSGTIAITKATQTANTVWAGPTTGSPATPAFRALVVADIPLGVDHGGLSGLADDDHTQYHTDARALTWLGTRSTTDLSEGTNLYYTATRFNTAFSGKSTTDLTEGTNLYYTATRFNTAFAAKSTTDLTEGTNLYYTAARFNTAFAAKSTSDLTEGTNLYYTDTRARAATVAQTITDAVTTSAPSQDAVFDALALKASTTLNNLGTTSINSDLLPSANGTRSLGSTTLTYLASWQQSMKLRGSTSGTLTQAANATTTDHTLTWPATQGGASTVLTNDGSGNLTWGAGVSAFATNWIVGDGATKVATHNLGTNDVMVQIYDENLENIQVDTIDRTSTSAVTLTSSVTPTGTWRVLIIKIA